MKLPCVPAVLLSVLFSASSPALAHVEAPAGAQTASVKDVGQQAVGVILKQYVLDPTVLVPGTGAPLSPKGTWSIARQAPASCPQASEKCVRVLYRVPEAGVSCEWTVLAKQDSDDGVVLDQNEDATRYLEKKYSPALMASLVLTRKNPSYPPMAAAAHVAGQVVVQGVVTPAGSLEKLVVIQGPEMLRSAAVEGAKSWTYKPLMVGSRAVAYQARMTFTFAITPNGPPTSGRVTSNPAP